MFIFNITDDKAHEYTLKTSLVCRSLDIDPILSSDGKSISRYTININESIEDEVTGKLSLLFRKPVKSSKIIVMLGGRAYPNDLVCPGSSIGDLIKMTISRFYMIPFAKNGNLASLTLKVAEDSSGELQLNGTLVGYADW